MCVEDEVEKRSRVRDEVVFRRLDDPVASWTKAGIRWAVEYWKSGMAYPVAQAWVVMSYGPYVDWLHVMEGHRRQGIGTALLKAIMARWPDVEFDAFTESGEQFLRSIEENESNTNRGERHGDD